MRSWVLRKSFACFSPQCICVAVVACCVAWLSSCMFVLIMQCDAALAGDPGAFFHNSDILSLFVFMVVFCFDEDVGAHGRGVFVLTWPCVLFILCALLAHRKPWTRMKGDMEEMESSEKDMHALKHNEINERIEA